MINKVRVNGIEYTITEVQNLNDCGKQLSGQVEYEKALISISNEMNHQFENVVLIHEMLHIILLNTEHKGDENLIDTIAYGINQVLTENKQFIERYNKD